MSKLVRTPGIYLAGFMGCGKTTVGRLLAYELGWNFVDLDEQIEAAEGCSIFEIFESRGEPAFRSLEQTAIEKQVHEVQCGRARVVALGGGAYARPENAELLATAGLVVWLDAPFELIAQRVAGYSHRPLAKDPGNFRALYEARRAAYSKADFRVEVAGDDARATVAKILELPLW
jgi:shikimate kinase